MVNEEDSTSYNFDEQLAQLMEDDDYEYGDTAPQSYLDERGGLPAVQTPQNAIGVPQESPYAEEEALPEVSLLDFYNPDTDNDGDNDDYALDSEEEYEYYGENPTETGENSDEYYDNDAEYEEYDDSSEETQHDGDNDHWEAGDTSDDWEDDESLLREISSSNDTSEASNDDEDDWGDDDDYLNSILNSLDDEGDEKGEQYDTYNDFESADGIDYDDEGDNSLSDNDTEKANSFHSWESIDGNDEDSYTIPEDEDIDNSEMADEFEENGSEPVVSKTSEPTKKKSLFKNKFEEFKKKASAELKGEDPNNAPKGSANEDAEEDTDNDNGAEDGENTPNKQNKGGLARIPGYAFLSRLFNMKPFQLIGKILRPLKTLYLAIVNLLFKAIQSVLGLFAKIPLIGKPFSWLLQFSHIIRYVATSIPLLLIIALIVYLNRSAVPPTSSTALPDQGAASIGQMSYDGDTGTAKGTITNSGEVIATVTPTFTVYSSSPLSPLSWPFPKERTQCKGVPVKLEIGQSKEVQAKCEDSVSGFFLKTTASLEGE